MGNSAKKFEPSTKTATEKVHQLIDEAIANVYLDRQLAFQLLQDLKAHMEKDPKTKEWSGAIAAKYIETMQRSNEQLVKVTSMIAKKTDFENDEEISDEEVDRILEKNTEEMAAIATSKNKDKHKKEEELNEDQ